MPKLVLFVSWGGRQAVRPPPSPSVANILDSTFLHPLSQLAWGGASSLPSRRNPLKGPIGERANVRTYAWDWNVPLPQQWTWTPISHARPQLTDPIHHHTTQSHPCYEYAYTHRYLSVHILHTLHTSTTRTHTHSTHTTRTHTRAPCTGSLPLSLSLPLLIPPPVLSARFACPAPNQRLHLHRRGYHLGPKRRRARYSIYFYLCICWARSRIHPHTTAPTQTRLSIPHHVIHQPCRQSFIPSNIAAPACPLQSHSSSTRSFLDA